MVQVKGLIRVLTIGELSSACGVPTSTIRFWERRGLIQPHERSGGQRRYTTDALSRVGMLLLCQDAGFTLVEIHELVTKQHTDRFGWRELVAAKMVSIDDSMRKLDKARSLLAHAMECRHEDITECPKFRLAVDCRAARRPLEEVDDEPAAATATGRS